jgi:hypothetical protein
MPVSHLPLKSLNSIMKCILKNKYQALHHLSAGIYGFFGRKKKIKFRLPTTTEEHIAHVNLLCKASNSLILMAINALIAIRLIHLLW